MMTLYTAIGNLKIKRDEMGNPVPVVINNRQELILWSCLAFQILQIYELEKAYAKRLTDSGRPEGLSFSHYLNRLLLRGLIVKGDGLTGVDALYRFLGNCISNRLPTVFRYSSSPASSFIWRGK